MRGSQKCGRFLGGLLAAYADCQNSREDLWGRRWRMGTLGVRRHDLPANGNVLVGKRSRRVSLGTSLGLFKLWPRGNGPRERRYSPAFRCDLARGKEVCSFSIWTIWSMTKGRPLDRDPLIILPLHTVPEAHWYEGISKQWRCL